MAFAASHSSPAGANRNLYQRALPHMLICAPCEIVLQSQSRILHATRSPAIQEVSGVAEQQDLRVWTRRGVDMRAGYAFVYYLNFVAHTHTCTSVLGVCILPDPSPLNRSRPSLGLRRAETSDQNASQSPSRPVKSAWVPAAVAQSPLPPGRQVSSLVELVALAWRAKNAETHIRTHARAHTHTPETIM